jgi:hypothetical protein
VRIRFTAIRIGKGSGHKSISGLEAVDERTGQSLEYSVESWISVLHQGRVAYLRDANGREFGVIVKSNGVTKWLQSHDRGVLTTHLLDLHRY